MKNQRALIFLLLSVVCGALTVYGFRLFVQSSDQVRIESPIETSPVVIAARDLPAGATIDGKLLDVSEWPSDYVPSGVFAAVESVVNRVPNHHIAAGEPITISWRFNQSVDLGTVNYPRTLRGDFNQWYPTAGTGIESDFVWRAVDTSTCSPSP